jgi:hypothetical protein
MFNAIDNNWLSGLEMGDMIVEGGVGTGSVGVTTELMALGLALKCDVGADILGKRAFTEVVVELVGRGLYNASASVCIGALAGENLSLPSII